MKNILEDLEILILQNEDDFDRGSGKFILRNFIKEKQAEQLTLTDVSVSLPSVDDAGIIAVEISEINNEMTAQEQAFFIAGFSECIKYLEMQSNVSERKIVGCEDPMVCLRGCSVHEQTCRHPVYKH